MLPLPTQRRHALGLHLTLGLGLALGAVAGSGRAHADPLPVRSGKIVLPITGLAIDLPKDARKNATWNLSGSWSLTNGGASFDGRDVVDLKVGDKLVAGNWIHVGHFDAGDCAAVVKELDVPDRWQAEQALYGQKFQAAGGTWDFANDLGKKPVIALCVAGPGGQALLLYHFFLDAKPPVGKAGLKALVKDPLLDRVTRAWATGKTGTTMPTKHPELKQRGDIAAVRTVSLANSKLEVALPDDGNIWLARSPKDGGGDFLDRMAPSLPDLTVELAKVSGMTCEAVIASMTEVKHVDEPLPAGLPAGWKAYPTMQLDSGIERLACRDVGKTALVVGLMVIPATAPEGRDFAPLAPLLQALVDAVGKAP